MRVRTFWKLEITYFKKLIYHIPVQNLAALKIVSNQAVRADLAVSDSAKIQVIPAYNIHKDLKALFLDGDVVPYGLGSRGQKYRINMEDNS
ncbi:hypothetical protein Tco_0316249 [Tanacetum coccineum]